jgi:hypothetical protein
MSSAPSSFDIKYRCDCGHQFILNDGFRHQRVCPKCGTPCSKCEVLNMVESKQSKEEMRRYLNPHFWEWEAIKTPLIFLIVALPIYFFLMAILDWISGK